MTPLDWARNEIGVTEKKGKGKKNTESRIVFYHSFTSLKATEDEVSWCSSFVCAAHEECGLPSTKSAAARSWLKYGKSSRHDVQVGDVVVFWREDIHGSKGHVALLAAPWKPGDDYVLVLGGNQDNTVRYKKYPAAQILDFRRAA